MKNQRDEAIARIIFAAMSTAASTGEKPQPWHEGGNSLMQDEARQKACMIIDPLRDLLKIQSQPGNVDQSEYARGLYNGMELCVATLENREPVYRLVDGFDPANIPTFTGELTHLLNRFSMETMGRGGDTPDFMLATFLLGVLKVYDEAMCAREEWFGRNGSSKLPVPVGAADENAQRAAATTKEPPKVRLPLRFPDRPILPQHDAHFDGPKPAEERKPELAPPPISDFVG